jgi:hypothetical protein
MRRGGRSLPAGGRLVLRGGVKARAWQVTRWASHFIDDIDRLTHLADDHYGAKMNGPHPTMAFTRCGRVVTWNGVRANTGTYVSTSAVLTCVRCVGGARDGRARRTELKNAMFMEMYGQPANKVLGPYAKDDVAMTLVLLSPRSVLRKCARLAAVFYLEASRVCANALDVARS